ncbi:tRNA(Ile)-lysidine synthetase [Hyphomonas johnsonii MHS-2]|uniref:tRNA(Ile)-lysidine synthetase n=1 Tax=Hyphomonas johnsonii MHS-2 TaxID=1280950 RepID=A0A059FNQ0_9PROT|nr:tRNA(Ile)-lysidine synthetase [Hyphomonas johnsonii MHS-2]
MADACARLGVDHAILDWATPEGRQAPARRARHAALAEAIRARGGAMLLMGHTADDQAETFLMRARRGSTWYGLAAMQAQALSPVWPEGHGVRIGRPLLSARRADLRALLRARGVHWVDDPSNQNPAFERVRVRRLLDASPRLAARVRHCLEGVTQVRAIEDGLTGKWLRTRVRMDADGRIEADIAGLEPECVARRAGLLIQVAAGRDARPRWDKLQLIAHRLCADRAFAGATLGGSRIKRRGKTVVFTAEYESDPLAGKRLDALRNLLSGKP